MKSQGNKINEIEGKIFEAIQGRTRQNTKGTAFLCIYEYQGENKMDGRKEGRIL